MDTTTIVMYLGFLMAAYSVVGNDVIQTLGTFLSSNEKRPWYILWGFAGGILAAILIVGYTGYGNALGLGGDDIAFNRLDKFDLPTEMSWWYLLPPITLLIITRIGIPVSTTFLILTFFSLSNFQFDTIGDLIGNLIDPNAKLSKMVSKSLLGYGVAFASSIFIYLIITGFVEKQFINRRFDNPKDTTLWTNRAFWITAQWLSTGFLWTQWLTQDLANIYVYLLGADKQMSLPTFIFSLVAIVGLLGYIFYSKGGAIQGIVKAKTNTTDIRSATIIDFIYSFVLLYFKYYNDIPMSTTWVFIGLLAGREIAMRIRLDGGLGMRTTKDIGFDLAKVFLGLVISVALVFIMKVVQG